MKKYIVGLALCIALCSAPRAHAAEENALPRMGIVLFSELPAKTKLESALTTPNTAPQDVVLLQEDGESAYTLLLSPIAKKPSFGQALSDFNRATQDFLRPEEQSPQKARRESTKYLRGQYKQSNCPTMDISYKSNETGETTTAHLFPIRVPHINLSNINQRMQKPLAWVSLEDLLQAPAQKDTPQGQRSFDAHAKALALALIQAQTHTTSITTVGIDAFLKNATK